MDQAACELLKTDAARYIWWETPDEAMRRPERVIAQVMNIGDIDDVHLLLGSIGEQPFKDVLEKSEPGWFNERSWYYWHYALGLCHPCDPIPPMPARRFS